MYLCSFSLCCNQHGPRLSIYSHLLLAVSNLLKIKKPTGKKKPSKIFTMTRKVQKLIANACGAADVNDAGASDASPASDGDDDDADADDDDDSSGTDDADDADDGDGAGAGEGDAGKDGGEESQETAAAKAKAKAEAKAEASRKRKAGEAAEVSSVPSTASDAAKSRMTGRAVLATLSERFGNAADSRYMILCTARVCGSLKCMRPQVERVKGRHPAPP